MRSYKEFSNEVVEELIDANVAIDAYVESTINIINLMETNESIRRNYFTNADEESEEFAKENSNKNIFTNIKNAIKTIFNKIISIFTRGKTAIKGNVQNNNLKKLAEAVKVYGDVKIEILDVWSFSNFADKTIDSFTEEFDNKNIEILNRARGKNKAINVLIENLNNIVCGTTANRIIIALAPISILFSDCPKNIGIESISIKDLYNRLVLLKPDKFPSIIASKTNDVNTYMQREETLKYFSESINGNNGAVIHARDMSALLSAYTNFHQSMIDYYLSIIRIVVKSGGYVGKKLTNESVSYDETYDGFDDIVTEKATREKYRMSRFKKKYNYDPKNKTIIVNGEKYKVDLDIKSPTMNVKNSDGSVATIIRQTAAELSSDDPTIHIDEKFFKLKNDRRRDATLQHEIGHVKMHSLVDNKHLDKAFVTGTNFDVFVKSQMKTLRQKLEDSLYTPTDKELRDEIIESLKEQGITKSTYTSIKPDDIDRAKLRKDMLKIVTKYKSKTNNHVNMQEVEADRYSANRTSEKDIKKGVNEIYKHAKKDKAIRKSFKGYDIYDVPDDVVKYVRKTQNKSGSEDMKVRSKALKDKDLRNSKIYK